jgi:hypothetical protein
VDEARRIETEHVLVERLALCLGDVTRAPCARAPAAART